MYLPDHSLITFLVYASMKFFPLLVPCADNEIEITIHLTHDKHLTLRSISGAPKPLINQISAHETAL